MSDMYHNWVYRPANFNEDIERWAFNCDDGLRQNLDQPESEDKEIAKSWAEAEAGGLDWYGEEDQPEDWGEFVADCQSSLEGEILARLKVLRADK